MHSNHPNWFANFKIMMMSFIAMLPVSRSPFSAWSDRCLTFFSLVRHVSQRGKTLCLTKLRHTHVSPFSIPDSNTDFAFATDRTLQPVHIVCIPSRISLFCIDPDDFQEIVWNKWQICCWWFKSTPCLAPSQFRLGPICLTSPFHFPELGNTRLHCHTAA